jgi:hypothetical protein
MGLNLSNQQIALELGLNKDDVQAMTTQLREGIMQAEPEVQLEGVIEVDECMSPQGIKATLKQPKKGRPPRRQRLKGKRGRGRLESEKPPILGLLERGGRVVLKMLANVQQKTIKLMCTLWC